MLSEVLLSATNIYKSYPDKISPIELLKYALLGKSLKDSQLKYVLEDINLTVYRGETLGIMGRNGAGKTTLLSILGKVISPTEGKLELNCKIATLLGLTAGFNQNFTGRENAYLFCSVQGIERKQADELMDLIRDFSELGDYFNKPLHIYSSGMQARLAFACAVHVNADLIIIDESLAVGDASFKMKCYSKINSMKQAGQTFILVSHNPNLVSNFCTRAILIENGKIEAQGNTSIVVDAYKKLRSNILSNNSIYEFATNNQSVNQYINMTNFKISEESEESTLIIDFELIAESDINDIAINFGVSNSNGIVICTLDNTELKGQHFAIKSGEKQKHKFKLNKEILLPGKYYISAIANHVTGDVITPLDLKQNFLSFEIVKSSPMSGLCNLNLEITKG